MKDIEIRNCERNELIDRIDELEQEVQANQIQMELVQNKLREIQNICQDISQIRSFKMAHFLSRYKYQFCKGTLNDKYSFICWVINHFDRRKVDRNHAYNPLYQIIYPLRQAYELTQKSDEWICDIENVCLPEILSESYKKHDVIVFSVIDYDFRYQRPQQIADHYARQGHRVFYINANFKGAPSIQIIRNKKLHKVTLYSEKCSTVYGLNNLFECKQINSQLDELLMKYGIRDALMIADYPTWIDSIDYLKSKYGFSLITDYMDDYTGFLTTNEEYVQKDCIKLLKTSDAVVASSQYLVNLVTKYNTHVTAIRNGTDFEHFHKAYGHTTNKDRKIIGYYGAIAEWFDFKKVEFLAKRFPECDIVLVGNITNDDVKKCGLHNVKKIGEIQYSKLPEYLSDFDVCLIPFDTSTNLIKATNPVKFYEYLSAGKKIVATEIPELEPYRDKYVYLSNDNEQFANYVRMCLEGTDQLADAECCFQFAKENDWECRVNMFESVAATLFPKVSIIVLCYNQLDYTKQCVQSILNQTAYPNYELILVDNCSQDDTAEYLREIEKEDQRIKVVLNTTNRGFAGGNNDGIAVSDGEYIVLLNNDTLVTRGWLTNMVKRFKLSDKVGMVGAVTNSIGNEAQIEIAYQDIADMPRFAYAYTAQHMGENYLHDGVLAMFCVMFSRKLMNEIGMLDENYGIGMFEDDDYSVAAKRAGYDLILPEDVFIHHFGSVSFKKLEDATYRKTFEANKEYFEKKWDTKWKMHHYRNS